MFFLPLAAKASPAILRKGSKMKRLILITILLFVLTSVVMAQTPPEEYTFRFTMELDSDKAPINWVVAPATAITWVESAPGVRELLNKKPAPFPVIYSTTVTLIVDTPAAYIPAGQDGAWWKVKIDLTALGIAMPGNSKFDVNAWESYKYTAPDEPHMDFSDPSAIVLRKRQPGKAVVVPG